MSKPRAVRITPLVPIAALLALTGCGGSKGSESSSSAASTPSTTASTASTATPPATGGASTVSLAANSEGQLAYNTKSLSAKAGNVTIEFTNNAALSHNVTIESSAGKVLGATPTFSGGSKSLSVALKPGTYKFFCSVPGHRMAGMEGTLVVK